jgi:hypothetical protein
MDGQSSNTSSAGNSSDFVRVLLLFFCVFGSCFVLIPHIGPKTLQVGFLVRDCCLSAQPDPRLSTTSHVPFIDHTRTGRMLEDPSYSEIVRWGDENDSFVVLEVCPVEITRHKKKKKIY